MVVGSRLRWNTEAPGYGTVTKVKMDIDQQDVVSYDVLMDSAKSVLMVAAKYVEVDVQYTVSSDPRDVTDKSSGTGPVADKRGRSNQKDGSHEGNRPGKERQKEQKAASNGDTCKGEGNSNDGGNKSSGKQETDKLGGKTGVGNLGDDGNSDRDSSSQKKKGKGEASIEGGIRGRRKGDGDSVEGGSSYNTGDGGFEEGDSCTKSGDDIGSEGSGGGGYGSDSGGSGGGRSEQGLHLLRHSLHCLNHKHLLRYPRSRCHRHSLHNCRPPRNHRLPYCDYCPPPPNHRLPCAALWFRLRYSPPLSPFFSVSYCPCLSCHRGTCLNAMRFCICSLLIPPKRFDIFSP